MRLHPAFRPTKTLSSTNVKNETIAATCSNHLSPTHGAVDSEQCNKKDSTVVSSLLNRNPSKKLTNVKDDLGHSDDKYKKCSVNLTAKEVLIEK